MPLGYARRSLGGVPAIRGDQGAGGSGDGSPGAVGDRSRRLRAGVAAAPADEGSYRGTSEPCALPAGSGAAAHRGRNSVGRDVRGAHAGGGERLEGRGVGVSRARSRGAHHRALWCPPRTGGLGGGRPGAPRISPSEQGETLRFLGPEPRGHDAYESQSDRVHLSLVSGAIGR